MRWIGVLIGLSLLAGSAVPVPGAPAALYQCIDADGVAHYTNAPGKGCQAVRLAPTPSHTPERGWLDPEVIEQYRREQDARQQVSSRGQPTVIPQEGWRRFVGLSVRGATLGILGADVPPRTAGERAVEVGGVAAILGLAVGAVVAARRGMPMQQEQRRPLGLGGILAGVAFLVFNLPDFVRGYGDSELWTAVGAVLLVAGILTYRSAGRESR